MDCRLVYAVFFLGVCDLGYGYSSPAVVAVGEAWSVLVGHYECPPVERSFLGGAVIANAIDCSRSVTHVAANCESVELFVMFMAIFSLWEEAFQRFAVVYGYPHFFNCRNAREAPKDLAVHIGSFGWGVNFFRYYVVNGT